MYIVHVYHTLLYCTAIGTTATGDSHFGLARLTIVQCMYVYQDGLTITGLVVGELYSNSVQGDASSNSGPYHPAGTVSTHTPPVCLQCLSATLCPGNTKTVQRPTAAAAYTRPVYLR